jgi:hypothetical protein
VKSARAFKRPGPLRDYCTKPQTEVNFANENLCRRGYTSHEFAELLLKKQLKLITGIITKLAAPHVANKFLAMKSRRGTKARRLRKAAIFSSKAPHKDAVLLIEEKKSTLPT